MDMSSHVFLIRFLIIVIFIHTMVTRMEPGYIRVEADEVTYPMHIILRYEIERALLEGSISVAELPKLWNAKMVE